MGSLKSYGALRDLFVLPFYLGT